MTHVDRRDFTCYVGRASDRQWCGDGRWGNPYRIGDWGMSREEVVARFRQDLLADPDWVRSVRCELAGEVLGCWCAPRACHAYVLAEVANCSEAHLRRLVGM